MNKLDIGNETTTTKMKEAFDSNINAKFPDQISGPNVWLGSDWKDQGEYTDHLTSEQNQELITAIRKFIQNGGTMETIDAKALYVPLLVGKINEWKNNVMNGRGFQLVRGLPVPEWSREEVAIAYLWIGSCMGKFRSQNATGHLLGHVRNQEKDIKEANTRYYQTNKKLEFHTDSVDIVGLLCLQTALEGGESRLCSSGAIYNKLMRKDPALVDALKMPIASDRRGEVPTGMKPWFDMPIFTWYENKLITYYVGQYIRSAQSNYPEVTRLTDKQIEAMQAIDEISETDGINLGMSFEVGDMQFVSNHFCLHSRGDFIDHDTIEKRRHLLRLWLAPEDGINLPIYYAQRYGSVVPGDRGGIVLEDTKLNFTLDDLI